jgi:exodeoxyribonuclease VII small subunit
MEGNELSLEESIGIFQEGMELAQFCNKKLDEVEKKINVIVKGKQGEVSEEAFRLEEE